MNEPDAIHDPAEAAALLAAGALPPAEAAALDARIDAGDDALAAEVASYDALILALADGVEPVAHAPSARQALLDRLTAPEAPRQLRPRRARPIPRSRPEVFVRRAEAHDWQSYGVPGIEYAVLQLDPSRNLQTCLVRAAAGVEFPSHPHPVVEACYVLEGDFQSHGATLLAGDYLRTPAGSFHPVTRTQGGCVLLIVSEIRAS